MDINIKSLWLQFDLFISFAMKETMEHKSLL